MHKLKVVNIFLKYCCLFSILFLCLKIIAKIEENKAQIRENQISIRENQISIRENQISIREISDKIKTNQ